ncbi:hypothetical protein J4429_05625 [Candidatus Pacearchaeota archaeon]|nr:hypothetical protein [Candidatus Pacearchaeota archaeon]
MNEIDDIIAEVSPYYKKKKKLGNIPSGESRLIYDSSSETLEPLYFWILDFAQKRVGKVEKLVDNFASSPGSGHFSELQGKSSQMQQEASRVLGTINNILKGVLNLIYDLKEFKIRMSHYEQAESKDKLKAEAGLLALKQIWMDKVDMQRGQGSINALSSGNLNFVTLRDAFMTVSSLNEVDKIDLNERVKRILKPRLQEFLEWQKRSKAELEKRFEIEKTYLKSQVESLKLNARWAKPYLRAAQQLTANEKLYSNPALVSVFNTIILELTLMAHSSVDVKQAIIAKILPKEFGKIKKLRAYSAISIIDFNFRGIPSKMGQHYLFGGKAEVTFKAYALNEDEIALFKDRLDDSDFNHALKFVQGMTDESLEQLKIDIDELLGDEKEEKEKKEGKESNPFSALFSFKSKKEENKEDKEEKLKKKIKELKEKGIKPDSYAEKYIRNLAEANAINNSFDLYEVYKKSHGMASFPYTVDASHHAPTSEAEKFFGV